MFLLDGKLVGNAWRELLGGSWLYGKLDKNGEFTGDNIAYIYEDLETAYYGQFKRGVMVCLDSNLSLKYFKMQTSSYFLFR